MRWAFAGPVDDPDARVILRQLIEENDEDALRLDGRAIEVDDMVPLNDPRRRGQEDRNNERPSYGPVS